MNNINKKVRLTLYLTDKQKKWVKDYANEKGYSMSTVISLCINSFKKNIEFSDYMKNK